jgi:CsoR family transcriptional regulator, copper-sensing transcriptional repressor
MLPNDLTTDIKTRLKTIKGQITAIIKMLDEQKNPEQILHQFKAADKGLQKAHYLLLDEVYRKSLAIKIVNVVDACPGNCGNEDKIEFIRQQFPTFKLDELTDRMREISEIERRMEKESIDRKQPDKKS